MEAYTDFASVYDTFMDETPYEEWADFIVEQIEKYGVSKPCKADKEKETETDTEEILTSEKNLVLDLGCGTGKFTEILSQKGYDMIGVDMSQEMLNIAFQKRQLSGSSILYLCQDMRELDLYSTVGTVVSVCDSVNYLLEDEDVVETFRLVNNYLYPGGIFIFDFNTLYKYERVIGDATIAENRDDCSFIWDNYYHEEEHINEYDLTIFVKEERELFRKFTETHYQRGYTLKEMEGFVKQAGLELLLSLDADTHKKPDKTSERIYIIAREKGKDRG
ncbi:MAG: class I SAM-dependent methyltransferase [Lachnospiraceae bacterium]|nr:class I SAM-dependent methyltransferase [Lachnospiraceae bacterium]